MTHINRSLFFLAGFLLFTSVVNASLFGSSDLTFSVDQKDYYFKMGEEAIIPLLMENTYGHTIDGLLTYSYTQEINQGGMRMSSSNSQSTSFSVKDGESTQGLNFGTSDHPSEVSVALKFVYDVGESRAVNLDGITIHFVSEDAQNQNVPNKQSSSSEENVRSQQSQNSQQDPFSQMSKEINQMMNNNQHSPSSQPALQNNQMNQDSSALKKEMQNQLEEREAMKQEFQKQVSQNEEFQKEHNALLSQGYNLTGGNFDPLSNNTGNFELNYKKLNGDNASLSGRMNNGSMEDIHKDGSEIRREQLNKLETDETFQKYERQLQKEGYSRQNTEFSGNLEKTNLKLDYVNQNNESASITAEIENDTVKNVKLKHFEKKKSWLWVFLCSLILGMIGYVVYRKLCKKNNSSGGIVKKDGRVHFNYRKESLKLLEKSQKLFEQGHYKDAYGSAGQAIRLFLSYKNNLIKEVTNDEIVYFLRSHNKSYKEVKECFDLCSLVEFAKYLANKKDFDKILRRAKKIIGVE